MQCVRHLAHIFFEKKENIEATEEIRYSLIVKLPAIRQRREGVCVCEIKIKTNKRIMQCAL
jgi:hypothetical protein